MALRRVSTTSHFVHSPSSRFTSTGCKQVEDWMEEAALSLLCKETGITALAVLFALDAIKNQIRLLPYPVMRVNRPDKVKCSFSQRILTWMLEAAGKRDCSCKVVFTTIFDSCSLWDYFAVGTTSNHARNANFHRRKQSCSICGGEAPSSRTWRGRETWTGGRRRGSSGRGSGDLPLIESFATHCTWSKSLPRQCQTSLQLGSRELQRSGGEQDRSRRGRQRVALQGSADLLVRNINDARGEALGALAAFYEETDVHKSAEL
eukprot:755442-Hanusia_phi.AAC.5